MASLEKPSVSCIIPTRDRCKMVLESLASVHQQKKDILELILVDDGSIDQTALVVTENYPETRIVRLSGQGPGAARNAGVEASRGDIIMFLDSDDIWLLNHVENLRSVLMRGFEVAYGTTLTLDQVNGGEFLVPDNGIGREGDCFPILTQWCSMVPSSVAVTRQAFHAVNGFSVTGEGEVGEDWDFFLRLAARFPFGFVGSKPITVRRLHSGSLSYLTGGHDTLLTLLNRLRVALLLNGTEQGALQRVDRLEQFVMEKGGQWKTVQEWYTAMKNHGLV